MKTKIKTNLNHTHLPEAIAKTLDSYVTALNTIETLFNEALLSEDYTTAEYHRDNAECIKLAYRVLRSDNDILYSKKLRYREPIIDAIHRDDVADAVTLVKLLGVSQKELCERAKIDYCNLSSEISGNRRMGVNTRTKLYKAIEEVLV